MAYNENKRETARIILILKYLFGGLFWMEYVGWLY